MPVLDLFDLSGKTALVTGASRGLGLAMAVALAEAGADVIGASASLAAEGSEVEKAVAATGRRFTAHRCDFSDRAATHRFLEALDDGPRIDILVNNAGAVRRTPIVDHAEEDWDHVLEVNLSAPFLLTRHVGRGMLARGRGKVIFTASVLSFQGGLMVPGYAATKGGVARLVQAFANEWAGRGVNVNAIAPGYMRSEMTGPIRDDPDRNRSIMERVPAGRWGEPGDLAGALIFLASAASDFVHGVTLPVDGGWLGR